MAKSDASVSMINLPSGNGGARTGYLTSRPSESQKRSVVLDPR